jgi:truncated hemoglobin YjbI
MKQEEWIHQVVKSFYDKARHDVLIGYHFRVIENFDDHIPRICAFWEIQLLGATERKLQEPFDVMKVHVPLAIKRGELGRWLLLFRKTLNDESTFETQALKELWLERLAFFEGVFLRFLGFQS